MKLPLFPVTVVGSWPRPPELLRAQARARRGELAAEEFERLADDAVLEALAHQESAGIDVVSDGEQRRDNFYSFVAEKLEGVRLMTLAEMLDIVEDKASFEEILSTLDVPAFSISNPTCVGPIERRAPLALDELRFLRAHTDRPIKVPLPGPYLLTRAMWVKEVTREVYATKEELGADVVRVLREEIAALAREGAAFIQLDEPVLTELVFTEGRPRTFMCASLAARKDPAEELEWAVELINAVVAGARDTAGQGNDRPLHPDDGHGDGAGSGRPRIGLHICRGNWSTREEILLEGSYHPLVSYLARLQVDQLVLEFATPRAGELAALLGERRICEEKELGLGVVNPRTARPEPPDAIVARVREALRYLPPDRIFLNPDCGFGTFSNRAVNTAEVARAKLESMTAAAARLRDGIG